MVLTEEEVCVTPQEVHRVLAEKGIRLSAQEDEEITSDEWEKIFCCLEQKMYEQWDEEERTVLLCVGTFAPFEVEMAEMICGNKRVNIILERIREKESGIGKNEGKYTVHPVIMKFLIWKRNKEYPRNKIIDIYNQAGMYYEAAGKLPEALECYQYSKNTSKFKDILIDNSARHPGTGYYYQMRKYYLALDETEIENSPVMMCAMSMLHAMLFQREKSEYWYQKLKTYTKEQKLGSVERKEAAGRLAYLDIASPYKGTGHMIESMFSAGRLLMNKEISLAEFSVTSNMPSLMNGGKDFSEWSKRDRELRKSIGAVVELVLGKMGVGLPDIAVAESQYEKGGDLQEIAELLNRGRFRAECNGKLEICFAAIGIMVRLNCVLGKLPLAEKLLQSFKEKIKIEEEEKLLLNIEALQCRLMLLKGENKNLEEWEQKLPNSEVEFISLERYRYLTKVRVYIAMGKYENALVILERLEFLAKEYERVYMLIEVSMLKAICLFRMGDENCKKSIQYAVRKAGEYSFIRLISEEGAAVLPLLKKMKLDGKHVEYRKHLLTETEQMARLYPRYLQPVEETVNLTDAEKKVLGFLCEGITAAQIAEQLIVSEATVRFHCRNIYKKLGVRGRVEAVNKAREMKII